MSTSVGLPSPFFSARANHASRAAQKTLDALGSNELLAPAARVVLEMDRREPVPEPPPGLRVADERRYGDTRLLILSAE